MKNLSGNWLLFVLLWVFVFSIYPLDAETDIRKAQFASASIELIRPEETIATSVVIPEEIKFENDSEDIDMISSGSQYLEEVASMSLVKPVTFEKVPALQPALMKSDESLANREEEVKIEKIKGMIVPEKHPVKRRRYLFRWVLKTEDKKRIPLKSNLTLLQIVRKEKLLDGLVMLTGYYVESAMNQVLKYFVVEKAVPAGDMKTGSEKEEK
ncbi:MAG: hypothetical protein ACQETH_00580 [Candidatus Rifleibacteriota bacterium]